MFNRLKLGDCENQKRCFKVLVNNASTVDLCIIIHKSRIKIHTCVRILPLYPTIVITLWRKMWSSTAAYSNPNQNMKSMPLYEYSSRMLLAWYWGTGMKISNCQKSVCSLYWNSSVKSMMQIIATRHNNNATPLLLCLVEMILSSF